MEQMRSEFEIAFAKSKSLSISDVESVRCGDDYWDEANLKTSGISKAWYFWQASRAAIELDLPKKYYSEAYFGNGCCDDYANDKLDEVYQVVRAAGLRVKESK